MSWWTNIRDAVEGVADVAINYWYPGAGMILEPFLSKGAQGYLQSPWGEAAMIGSGLAGYGNFGFSNYGAAMDAMSSGFSGLGTSAGAGGGTADAANTWSLANSGYVSPAEADAAAANATAAGGGVMGTGAPATDYSLAGTSGAAPTYTGQTMPGAEGYFGGVGSGGALTAPSSGGSLTPQVAANAASASNVAKAAGAMPWGSTASNINVASGLYGLLESQRMNQAALAAQKAADPFGPYRDYYAKQIQAIQADPSLITKLPGYDAGQQAIGRSMAAQGYIGSGNMMAAMQKYGGDFYNQTLQNYANLAGAQFSPADAARLGLQGQQYGTQLASQGLGSLGYAGLMATTNPYAYNQYPPIYNPNQNPYAIYPTARSA